MFGQNDHFNVELERIERVIPLSKLNIEDDLINLKKNLRVLQSQEEKIMNQV